MTTFMEFARDRALGPLSESPLGTLLIPSNYDDTYMVRHFDREWPPALLTTYLDMLAATQLWIDKYPGLASMLRVELPWEIGDDFYAMSFYPYYSSTDHIMSIPVDVDPEPQAALSRLVAEFLKASKSASGERDVLIASILSRSVTAPNAWTFMDDDRARFVVVDPPATRVEGEMWLAHPAWHANPA